MKNRWVRVLMVVIGVPAIVLAGWYTYRDIKQLEAPPLWALPPAAIANLGALWCSAKSWSVLFGDAVPRRTLDDAFFTSQLMKYTPVGGIAQAIGQAALARTETVGGTRAATAMLVSKLTMVLGGGAFGPVLALFSPELPGWARLGLLFTPVVLVFARRELMQWLLAVLRKVIPQAPDDTVLPSQREVWVSVAWAVPGLGLAGLSFALLAEPAGLGSGYPQATAGFALAWVVGFLVIPVPSGIGVREAALGLLVGGTPGAKLVAAVLFRAVAIVTEMLMLLRVRLVARRSGVTGGRRGGPQLGSGLPGQPDE